MQFPLEELGVDARRPARWSLSVWHNNNNNNEKRTVPFGQLQSLAIIVILYFFSPFYSSGIARVASLVLCHDTVQPQSYAPVSFTTQSFIAESCSRRHCKSYQMLTEALLKGKATPDSLKPHLLLKIVRYSATVRR